MTITQALKKASILLESNLVDNPTLEARILISYTLDIDQKKLILDKDSKNIPMHSWIKIKKLIKKRKKGSSIASIIKTRAFYDIELFVNKSVLIPRPETELLIDIILEQVNKNKNLSILDIGTGSGNIAITLAKHLPLAQVDALDISKKALKITRYNIKKNNIDENRIKLIKNDFFKLNTRKKYDIIVSNPPYIKKNETKELLRKKILSDPVISLDGGNDGLKFYRKLAQIAESNLIKDGWLFLEHGMGQREEIINIFNQKHFKIKAYNDLAKIDRAIALQYKG